jgi:heme o synthase
MPATAPPQAAILRPAVAADVSRRGLVSENDAPTGVGGYAGIASAVPTAASWLAIYADLFKARLTCLVLLTTLVGFYVGFRGPVDYGLLCHLLLGTALVASGASALNQWVERAHDARMRRTQDRPLPSGRLQPQTVLVVGCVSATLGLIYLARAVNPTTSLVGALTLGSYLFVYTPLKRVTWLNTLVGAVPGALPPLLGWTAARGELSGDGLALFAIQACWQVPHFMAIAWIYREEYARAGFQMLPVVDPQGRRTANLALVFTLALLPASVWPVVLHLAGPVYLAGALLLSLSFVWFALKFARATRAAVTSSTASVKSLPDRRAWQLFYLSLLYLPLLLTLMVLDKIK